MILPSKHLPPARSLLGIGAEILAQLNEPRAVSEVWERVRSKRASMPNSQALGYDEFVLSMTFLHAIAALDLEDGLLRKSGQRS